MEFADEEVVLSATTLAGKKMILIAHGDLVDREDTGYLRLRKFFRSKAIRSLSSFIPGETMDWIGKKLSRPLEQKAREIPDYWTPDEQKRLREIFRKFAEEKNRQGFDYIVLGHCHDLDEITPFYWNMGYPPVHRQFLYYDSTEDLMKRRSFF